MFYWRKFGHPTEKLYAQPVYGKDFIELVEEFTNFFDLPSILAIWTLFSISLSC